MKNKGIKKTFTGLLIYIIIIIVIIGLANSIFIVYEDEVAVINTLGKISKAVIDPADYKTVKANITTSKYDVNIVSEKGLNFKIPFIQQVQKYSSKYITYLSDQELINTLDGRRIMIQTYAQYRVADPVTYKVAVQGNSLLANQRMDEYIYKTVINTVNQLSFNEFFYREKIEGLLKEKVKILNEQLVSDFGIYVSDIGINRKTFPEQNVATIEEKMSKEIEKESQKLIAEGDSEYLQAKAMTDRQRSEIVAKATETAAKIKSEADAEAIGIYQEALSKDLELYKFIKRMEAYKKINNSTIFLDQNNEMLKYINGY